MRATVIRVIRLQGGKRIALHRKMFCMCYGAETHGIFVAFTMVAATVGPLPTSTGQRCSNLMCTCSQLNGCHIDITKACGAAEAISSLKPQGNGCRAVTKAQELLGFFDAALLHGV